jgi:hypothetical protein
VLNLEDLSQWVLNVSDKQLSVATLIITFVGVIYAAKT